MLSFTRSIVVAPSADVTASSGATAAVTIRSTPSGCRHRSPMIQLHDVDAERVAPIAGLSIVAMQLCEVRYRTVASRAQSHQGHFLVIVSDGHTPWDVLDRRPPRWVATVVRSTRAHTSVSRRLFRRVGIVGDLCVGRRHAGSGRRADHAATQGAGRRCGSVKPTP